MKRTIDKKPQLQADSRELLHKNLVDRMTAATKEIRDLELKTPATEKEKNKREKELNYLRMRYEQLQISYRLIYNTNWIAEQCEAQIINYKTHLVRTDIPLATVIRYKQNLKAFEKAAACRKCGGHGYIGSNISKGEFNLCQCVIQNIEAYKNL